MLHQKERKKERKKEKKRRKKERKKEKRKKKHDETQVGLNWKYPISELIKLWFTGRLNFCQQKEINPYQIGLTCQIK